MGNIAAPTADTAALKTLLGGTAYILKSITGESDWKNNPKINLATLATLVGNLSSGSDVTWDGQKFTNAKLGVSGLMAQNGYIQFGPNFGGLIIQWINDMEWQGGNTVYKRYDYPLAFTQVLAPLLGSTCGSTFGEASAEGASIQKIDNLGLSVLCEWSRGFIASQITIIVIGI